MSIEAMKEALEAIETYGFDYMHGMPKKHYTKLLQQAIEEAEKPVHDSDMSEKHVHKTDKNEHEPVYNPPFECPRCGHYCREWVGLTDEEIKEIVGPWGDTQIKGYTRKLFDAIEAKLKEKNT